jgi:hypothetical protein
LIQNRLLKQQILAFQHFQALVRRRIKFTFFLLAKLPSAWLCGVRVRGISENEAIVSVPYKWLSQNPFRSIYFACQAMAAEMSTGLLAMGHLHGRNPPVSMLVTRIEAVFTKKATERIYFTCHDGLAMKNVIDTAASTGEGYAFTATSTGKNGAGEIVSEFRVEWSFKPKKQS